jgi:hypothetical protein
MVSELELNEFIELAESYFRARFWQFSQFPKIRVQTKRI